MSKNDYLTFTFILDSNSTKKITRFLAAVALPPIFSQILNTICWEEWRPAICPRRRTDFKVAKEEDHYWSCVTIKSCLCINWHIYVCISLHDLKNISLSPWQLRGLTTISPSLDILGRYITASFRKDGLKEWGILLVVCPPSSSGCRQHRPSTLSWRVLQGIDHNNQVIETNTRCYCKTSLHRVHSHGRIVFACNFRHNFPDMSCIN